jgi:hypothetical protein
MNFTKQQILALCLFFSVTACGMDPATGTSDSSGTTSSGSSSLTSDESDTEAAYTSAVEALMANSGSSSSSDSFGSSASLTASSSYLAVGAASGAPRPDCDDPLTVDQSFSCDNSDGSIERSVEFTDCVMSNDFRTVTLNGSLTNSVENGGDGLCTADDTFKFANMVMGRDGEDEVHYDAVHHHETGSDGMVYSFTNARGNEVSVTEDSTHTITYTDAVDEDEDGDAEGVMATIEREVHVVHSIDGSTAHDVNVFTEQGNFTSTSEEGTATDISITLPVHELALDEDGRVTTRTIASGNLVVDHNLAQIRMVFGVGEEGLTFEDGTCGPVSGTMNVTGYLINDDDTIGDAIGTGSVTFADGEVESAEFDGAELNLRPRPCI